MKIKVEQVIENNDITIAQIENIRILSGDRFYVDKIRNKVYLREVL